MLCFGGWGQLRCKYYDVFVSGTNDVSFSASEVNISLLLCLSWFFVGTDPVFCMLTVLEIICSFIL